MPIPSPIVYELDPTGVNPDNAVSEEPFILSNLPVRAIVPQHGPIYTNGLIVRDANGTPLQRQTHYQCVELHQEATLKFGKEICSVILITDPGVTATGDISYQALGGVYTNGAHTIAQLYENLSQNAPQVLWENILNKPDEFLPTMHPHLIHDIRGFEPIVNILERIRDGVTLSQTSLLMTVINNLSSRFQFSEIQSNIPSKKLVSYDALLAILSRMRLLSNLTVEVDRDTVRQGQSFSVRIHLDSPLATNTPIYWFVHSNASNESLIPQRSGQVSLRADGTAEVYFYVTTNTNIRNDNIYIGLKINPSRSDYDAVTYDLNAVRPTNTFRFFLTHREALNHLAFPDLDIMDPTAHLFELGMSRGTFGPSTLT